METLREINFPKGSLYVQRGQEDRIGDERDPPTETVGGLYLEEYFSGVDGCMGAVEACE